MRFRIYKSAFPEWADDRPWFVEPLGNDVTEWQAEELTAWFDTWREALTDVCSKLARDV